MADGFEKLLAEELAELHARLTQRHAAFLAELLQGDDSRNPDRVNTLGIRRISGSSTNATEHDVKVEPLQQAPRRKSIGLKEPDQQRRLSNVSVSSVHSLAKPQRPQQQRKTSNPKVKPPPLPDEHLSTVNEKRPAFAERRQSLMGVRLGEQPKRRPSKGNVGPPSPSNSAAKRQSISALADLGLGEQPKRRPSKGNVGPPSPSNSTTKRQSISALADLSIIPTVQQPAPPPGPPGRQEILPEEEEEEASSSSSGLSSDSDECFSGSDAEGDDPLNSKTYDLLPSWKSRAQSKDRVPRRAGSILNLQEENTSAASRFIIMPSSNFRVAWDVIASCLVLYDLFHVPLRLLGGIRLPELWQVVIGGLCAFFWTLDMVIGFLTSYETKDGVMERKLRATVCRYARTDFPVDIIVVTQAWVGLMLDDRYISLLISLRLLRLPRVGSRIILLVNRIQSERLALLLSITQIIIMLVFTVHLIACCWIAVGRKRGGWIDEMSAIDPDQYGSAYGLYMYSYHWALCQFYGNGEHVVVTVEERTFAVVSLLLAFFSATAFVANVTSSMTRLHLLNGQQAAHQRVLRNYLQEHKISMNLSERLLQNAKQAIAYQQRNISESDVQLLQVISDSLLVELHYEMHMRILCKHPLFEAMAKFVPLALRKLCHTGVSISLIAQEDVLFERGEAPATPQMLFLAEGTMRYSVDAESFHVLEEGQWICEQALWTDWIYHGVLIASSACRVLLVDAAKFQELYQDFHSPSLSFTGYAHGVLKFLNGLKASERSDLLPDEQVKLMVAKALRSRSSVTRDPNGNAVKRSSVSTVASDSNGSDYSGPSSANTSLRQEWESPSFISEESLSP